MNDCIPIHWAIGIFLLGQAISAFLAFCWANRAWDAGREDMEREMKRAYLRQVSNQLRLSHPQPFFRAVLPRHE